MRAAGFGFLVLWNGRLDAEILKAGKVRDGGRSAGARRTGAAAAAAARAEGFPAGATMLFLDQEEGGRLLPEQAGYLLWVDGGGGEERVSAGALRERAAGAGWAGQDDYDGRGCAGADPGGGAP